MSLWGPVLARLYGALVYVSSLALIFFAAMLTGTHARVAFIYIFLPGVLLAVLSPFIWSGSRSAMLLAFAVAVVVQFLIVGSDPLNWWLFLAMPVVFGALTVVGLVATVPERDRRHGARRGRRSLRRGGLFLRRPGGVHGAVQPFPRFRLARLCALCGAAGPRLPAV